MMRYALLLGNDIVAVRDSFIGIGGSVVSCEY